MLCVYVVGRNICDHERRKVCASAVRKDGVMEWLSLCVCLCVSVDVKGDWKTACSMSSVKRRSGDAQSSQV